MPEAAWHRRARFARKVARMSPQAKVRKLDHHGSSPTIGLLVASQQPASMPGPWGNNKNQGTATDLVFKIHHSAYDVGGKVARCNGYASGKCKLYLKQMAAGRLFLHEHPANATSWDEPCVREVLQHKEHRLLHKPQLVSSHGT